MGKLSACKLSKSYEGFLFSLSSLTFFISYQIVQNKRVSFQKHQPRHWQMANSLLHYFDNESSQKAHTFLPFEDKFDRHSVTLIKD